MLNTDYSLRIVVETDALPWQASPWRGVQRKWIEGGEASSARSTSLVRHGAGAARAPHGQDGAEEILVLEGSLSDAQGDYPAGTYLRIPNGSSLAPAAAGCLLLVKTGHLDSSDRARTAVDIRHAGWHQGLVDGLTVLPLGESGTQHTAMVRWAPGTFFNPHRHWGGEEIFVVEGVFEDEHGRYPPGTWIRSPHLSQHEPYSREGCLIYVKTGHLPECTQAL